MNEIAKELKIRNVIYNELSELIKCLQYMNKNIVDCEKSMFVGNELIN